MEAPTKADETMILPLAQKMSKVLDRCTGKAVRTELVGGLGNTYGFDIIGEEGINGVLAYVSPVLQCHVLP